MLSTSSNHGNVAAAVLSHRPSSPSGPGAAPPRTGASDPDRPNARHDERPGDDGAAGLFHALGLLWAIVIVGVPLLLYCILAAPK